jgi:hypothetical protein
MLILFFIVGKRDSALPKQKQTYPISRQISYSFTIKNTTNRVIENAEFWCFAPVKKTATQVCRTITSSHGYNLVTDSFGNQILHYTLDLMPPYGSKIITVTANLNLSDSFNTIDAGDLKLFLKPRKYMETDHPDIIRTAEKFTTPDTLETARKAFDWIAGNLKYAGYISRDRGALYALKNKKGDCTESMYLFAAFCRVNNIPARCMGGYTCRENAILKPSGLHNWAEMFHGGTWKLVDPQKKAFMKNLSHYIATRIIDESLDKKRFQRFRFKGQGLRVKMNG